MKICRVTPELSTCKACLETQSMFNVIDDCSKCECNNRMYELIKVGSDFWGSYAIVLFKGKPEKVSLSRVIDIKNKSEVK